MAGGYEAPAAVRELEKMLTSFTYHNGFEISRVFDDWLQYIIFNFTIDQKPIPEWKYKPEQNMVFHQLMCEWVKIMEKEVTGLREWYDAFGKLYEAVIVSNSRASNAGQFFTPETVVDFMTKIQGDTEELKGRGLKISDPTCGSGRTLISFHAHAPGNYLYGEDIDRTCAMMSVCNFLIHGAVGEIVWHDSLNPDSWFYGWKVNENLNNPLSKYYGLPHVEKLQKEESFVWYMWQKARVDMEEKKEKVVKISKPVQVNAPEKAIQLELF